MNKKVRKITYITLATLILSLSITPMFSIVVAEENEKQPRLSLENHVNQKITILSGYGIATDRDDEVYKSHIKLTGEIIHNNDTDSSKQFQVLRGGIVINDNGTRAKYSIINETWSATLSEGKFVASGSVQDEEGNEYQVSLKGNTIRRSVRGVQMLVEGELNGDESSFKLQYITVLKHKHARMPIQITE